MKPKNPLDLLHDAQSLGEHIDALYSLRTWRLELERQVEEIKEKERLAKYDVINALRAEKMEGSRGKLAVVRITKTLKPRLVVGKWLDFWNWARKDKLGVYIQKRIGEAAIGEQWAVGKEVPGIYAEEIEDLSITKSS